MNMIDTEMKEYLSIVVSSFSPGIRYACAYGSGVFKQSGHKSIKDNMIDFIFVIDDAYSWHERILFKYPDHYSFMKLFGAKAIANFQNYYAAGVYFNTRVNFNGRLIKYGVLDMKTFVSDLHEWKDLYIAGRLQKPVLTLVGLDDPKVAEPFTANLRSALLTSLFMLPCKFTYEELFIKIASLSYTGDPRMVVGEDKGKVKNIVVPNIEKFLDLYNPILASIPNISVQSQVIEQNMDPEIRYHNFLMLPKNLSSLVCRNLNFEKVKEDFLKKKFIDLSSDQLYNSVAKSTAQIVRRSSTTQTMKNSVTAGVTKSLFYSGEKLRKMIRGFIR